MTVVSNDPSWWPMIDVNVFFSYWTVAAGVVVVYDWILTLGQEIELIWRQRWSLMTMLYFVIRYVGPPYSFISALPYMTMFSLTDTVAAMLGVIMIARLHAMYQRSRTMLIFLVVIFLVVNIACLVIAAIGLEHLVAEELILSGMYMCYFGSQGNAQVLASMVWMLNTVWEVLALCLAIWIAVKHFRDLRRLGSSTIGNCFRVLIKSHVLYFASFVGVSCLQLAFLSLLDAYSKGAQILNGAFDVFLGVEMFVLGPRLILSVREYHANLVADSDAETSMATIIFQERVHVPTSSTV
ncbi:hypothetical protein BDR03DRAFT_694848 [Suillus americanus]|nr:hypothetical protein BDR03DRAFT_301077 [Suillus americanus]KAG2033276.1 hypothetical protein BDR03DRAFT_694848 [Suillus americanus]